jgi:hypothetical protein
MSSDWFCEVNLKNASAGTGILRRPALFEQDREREEKASARRIIWGQ